MDSNGGISDLRTMLAAEAAELDPEPGAGLRGRASAAMADRVPVSVRGAVVNLDRRAVAAVAAVGLVGVLLGGIVWFRSRPAALDLGPPVAAVAPAQAGASVAPSAMPVAAADADAQGTIVVHVAGRVRKPGVVRLPAGSRVIDAIEAAGGIRPGTDLTAVNLARVLTDGEQVLVGLPPGSGAPPPAVPAGGGGSSTIASGPLDLNAATFEQLQELPGVGPVLAQRILDYRTEHGGFRSVDELQQVSGIGDARFQELADQVRV